MIFMWYQLGLITIRLDAAAGSDDLTKFIATTYTINGTVKVASKVDFAEGDLNAEYDTLVFKNVSGKIDTSVPANATITRASGAKTLASDAITADFTLGAITGGTIDTTINTVVGIGVDSTSKSYDTLGPITVDCAVEAAN